VEKVSEPREARSNPINVLAKAGALLDALDAHGELTPSELADALGEPRSSVYRLLSSLEGLGFVAPGMKRGTVQLGMKLYRLGNSAVRNRDIRSAALPSMTDLRDKTGSTVFLAIRTGDEALCLERMEGHVIVNNALLPGTTGPLHVGAVGKVLLAAEPAAFWDEYAERTGLPGFTPRTIVTREALHAALAEVIETGIAISDEDRLLGMAGVGAPIRDHEHKVVGAVSFSGMKPLVLAEHLEASLALIREGAATISSALGYDSTVRPR
jgi:DNA-binding IclR family transcriptional regulator